MINKLNFKMFASEHDKIFQLQDKVNEIIAAVNKQEVAIKNLILLGVNGNGYVECDWCDSKGYIINEDHPKYPDKQQRLDCSRCDGSGKIKV